MQTPRFNVLAQELKAGEVEAPTMRWRWTLVLVVALLTAGCIGDASDQVDDETSTPVEDRPQGPSNPEFGSAVNVSTERAGGEPMLDVGPDGTIFLAGTGPGDSGVGPEQTVWRSTDDGQTWEDVSPALPTSTEGGLDNALAVGPEGTVYYFNAVGQTPQMFRSQDAGASWTPVTPPTPPGPVHRTWIVPRGNGTVHFAGLDTPPSNNAIYRRSSDRGTTWGPGGLIGGNPLGISELAVADGGEDLYMVLDREGPPVPEDPQWTVAASHDGGSTWTQIPMWTFETDATSTFTPLDVDADGTLYWLWTQMRDGTSLLHYAYSTDQGESWSKPVPIGDEGGSQTLAWMDVRASGELGVVYYAANETGHPMEVDGEWYAEYTFVDDADTPDPETYRTRLTSWPVHEGAICATEGAGCPPGTRPLFDFTWIRFGPEDRAHAAFASSQWDQPASFPVYAGERAPFQPPRR